MDTFLTPKSPKISVEKQKWQFHAVVQMFELVNKQNTLVIHSLRSS